MKQTKLAVIVIGFALCSTVLAQEVITRPRGENEDNPPMAPNAQAQPRATPQPVGRDFTMGWSDPNTQGSIAGYKLKYGATSGNYTTTIDVPGQAGPPPAMKTKALVNVPLGPQFFVVTAYNFNGIQSPPSTPELAVIVATPTPTPTPTPTATPTPTPMPPTNLGIVQTVTRAKVGSGNEQMAASFTVESPTKVCVRALGPSLLSNLKPVNGTKLELRDTNGVFIEGNDGWKTGPDKQELIDSGYAPPNDKESALIATVAPGTYNVTVSPDTGKTGVGQVEVFAVK